MTQVNEVKQKEIILEGKSKGGDDSRTRTSMFIAMAIIPIIFFATVQLYPMANWLETVFSIYAGVYQVALVMALLYVMHEFVNFITPKKENSFNYLMLMISFSIVAATPLAINTWNYIFGIFGGLNFLELHIDGKILMIILLVIAVIVNIIFGLELKEITLTAITSLILYGFFSYLIYFTITGGWEVVFLFIILAVSSDTFAYIGGLKFGTTKPFPEISPSKSKEGYIIGLFAAIMIGVIWFLVIFLGFGSISSFLAGNIYSGNDKYWLFLIIPAASLFAPMGDLFFSKIKRTYNKKDFSNLLPGHGGILDRIDSHIFVMISAGLLTAFLV